MPGRLQKEEGRIRTNRFFCGTSVTSVTPVTSVTSVTPVTPVTIMHVSAGGRGCRHELRYRRRGDITDHHFISETLHMRRRCMSYSIL